MKMSTTTRSRSSALCTSRDATNIVGLSPVPSLLAGRACLCAAHHPERQFLFDTNEPLPLNQNIATRTKQSTSLFLFDTNQRPAIAARQSLLTTHAFLIAGEKILKTALTPSVPTPSVFLIAGVSATFCRSAHSGSRGAACGSNLAICGSAITTQQSLLTHYGDSKWPKN